jgi:3-hydroxymyristoyl/3-hydroxydecanoyl-(acyl carrier protein) dehydratase
MPPTVVCSEDLDGAPPAALAEWTAQVAAIPGVEDAAAILAGADLFAAVVAPGLDEARLRESMARSGQRLPARLRLVAALPRDGNGRLPAPAVYRMFGLGPRGLPRSRELEWSPEVVAQADGGHRFAVRVPRDYACFDGHFPGYPVLAGAVQLAELILPCLRRLHPEAGRVAHWSGIKFQARIAPGDDLSVVLLPASKPRQLHFAVWRDERKCSSGRLSF